MKINIGIFQDKMDATRVYRQRLADIASLTEVGPFFSKNQAVAWMDELLAKITNSEIVFIPDVTVEHLQWYGFTFEE